MLDFFPVERVVDLRTKIKIISQYLSTLIFLFKKMKKLSESINSMKGEVPFSDTEKNLNKKRKKMTLNNKKLGKKNRPNSLDSMTKEVMKYIIQSKQDYINLKNIAKEIKIPKRRIYDVINVLQGKF